MSKETVLIVLGVLLLVVPFIGLTSFIRTVLTVLVAGAIILIGISLKARMRAVKKSEEQYMASEVSHEELRGEE